MKPHGVYPTEEEAIEAAQKLGGHRLVMRLGGAMVCVDHDEDAADELEIQLHLSRTPARRSQQPPVPRLARGTGRRALPNHGNVLGASVRSVI